jgi:hypothetical protein
MSGSTDITVAAPPSITTTRRSAFAAEQVNLIRDDGREGLQPGGAGAVPRDVRAPSA